MSCYEARFAQHKEKYPRTKAKAYESEHIKQEEKYARNEQSKLYRDRTDVKSEKSL